MTAILVVEDEVSIATMVRLVLEDAGYQVRVAGNGQEALKLLAEAVPDLVLSDVMMPVVDGRQLFAALRVEARYRTLPAGFMSAVPHVVQDLVDTRVSVIRKPFDIDTLLNAIACLLAA